MRELRQHLPWDRHCAWCITYIKFRELRWFSQGHTAKQHQGLDLTPEATAASAKPLKKVQREPLAIKFLYLCQWNPSRLPHGRCSWWAWMGIHSLLVKKHSLCAHHAALDVRCVSTGVRLGRKMVSINFQTLPRNQSSKTQCTRRHHPGELSVFHQQDYPRSGPFKQFFRMLVVTVNVPRDPAPAYVSRPAGQGHAAAFLGGLLTNSSLPQNTLYSIPVPVLNQLIPSHSSSLSFNVTSRETPLSWASLLVLGSLIYALKVNSMFQNSYKNTCQDGCRAWEFSMNTTDKTPCPHKNFLSRQM